MIWKPKYKIWWNDKEGIKAQKKYGIPIVVISGILIYIIVYNTVTIKEFIYLLGAFSIFTYSIVSQVLRLPHGLIDEKSSNEKQKYDRIWLFFIGIITAYLIAIPILAKYYSFFETFIGAQFLIEHMKF